MRSTAYILVIAVIVIALFAVAGVLTQFLYAWIIPDVFSGMVESNLLHRQLTFWQAIKLELLLTLWFGGASAVSSRKK